MCFYIYQITSFLSIQSELCTYPRFSASISIYFYLLYFSLQNNGVGEISPSLSFTLQRNSERMSMRQNLFWLDSMVTKPKEQAVFWVNGLASKARCLLKVSQALRRFLCLPAITNTNGGSFIRVAGIFSIDYTLGLREEWFSLFLAEGNLYTKSGVTGFV